MTSPSLITEPTPAATAAIPGVSTRMRLFMPIFLFLITLLSTSSVGMRYMYNFQMGRPPLASDADILPFDWVFRHFSMIGTGLPFSITLIAILLAHEFGHYFACRAFRVRCSLPYLLPAPSLSGSFGAVIRLRSKVRTRAALIVIGAMGPICGFAVAVVTVGVGLHLSHYAPHPLIHNVQAPLLITISQALFAPTQSIFLLIPHPMLTASWMGLLITALNLIPAGQLDGGHILYAISPVAHKWVHRAVVIALLLIGVFYWVGWILWGIILTMPAMRHPQVPDDDPIKPWHVALIPTCVVILILSGTFQPFHHFSLLEVIHKARTRY